MSAPNNAFGDMLRRYEYLTMLDSEAEWIDDEMEVLSKKIFDWFHDHQAMLDADLVEKAKRLILHL